MTATASPDTAPRPLTPDLIDEAAMVYRRAYEEADQLLVLDPVPLISGEVDPRDRFAMFALLTWLKTAAT